MDLGGLPLDYGFPSWIWPMVGVWMVLGGGYMSFEFYLLGRRLGRWTLQRLAVARGMRRLLRQAVEANPAGRADGETVRVRGVVESEHPVRSRYAGHPVVVALSWVLGRRGELLDAGYHARAFSVRLASGDRIDVLPGDDVRSMILHGGRQYVFWVGASGTFRGGEVRETVIAPGDSVDVVGRLELTVDPDGDRSDPRAAPVRRALVPAPGAPLVIAAPQHAVRARGDGTLAAELAERRRMLPAVQPR